MANNNAQIKGYKDFSKGIISPKNISRDLLGEGSVQFAMNIDFDEVYGHATARKGSIQVGSAISGATDIYGINAIRTFNSNIPVVAVRDGSASRMYYWNGSAWTASTGWTGKGLGKHRFASLNGSIFVVNGTNDMMSSTNGASWVTTNCPTSLVLSYITRYRGRLFGLTPAGVLYFSSIVNPSANPFITWTTATDNIIINPDDGGYASGFALVGSSLLVFKNNGFYRVDATNSAVTPDDLYHVGAISQEAITVAKGIVYFYSGTAVYTTNGTLDPQEISRPIQHIIEAIPDDNEVYMTSNEQFVYMFVGDLNLEGEGYSNVVLRYSIRSDSWTLYSYPYKLKGLYYNDKDNTIYGGGVNLIYKIEQNDTTDNTNIIPYSLVMQEMDSGSRAYPVSIQGTGIHVFTKNGLNSRITTVFFGEGGERLETREIDNEFKNFIQKPQEQGRYFDLTWSGVIKDKRPVFEGIEVNYKTSQVNNL
jgi:hypothetical protein